MQGPPRNYVVKGIESYIAIPKVQLRYPSEEGSGIFFL